MLGTSTSHNKNTFLKYTNKVKYRSDDKHKYKINSKYKAVILDQIQCLFPIRVTTRNIYAQPEKTQELNWGFKICRKVFWKNQTIQINQQLRTIYCTGLIYNIGLFYCDHNQSEVNTNQIICNKGITNPLTNVWHSEERKNISAIIVWLSTSTPF